MRSPRCAAALALLALAVATGCGSTVPLGSQAQVSGTDGSLSAQDPATSQDGSSTAGMTGAGTSSSGGVTGGTASTGTSGGSGGSTTGTGGASGSTGGTSGSTSSTGTSGQLPGKRVSGSIQVGFVNTSVGNAGAVGLDAGQSYSTDRVFRGLVNAMNVQGGLAGRKIIPVTAETDTAAANWDTQFQAACSTFTEDHKVEAVVGYVFGLFQNFESCLAKKGVVHLNGAYTVGDSQDLAAYPSLFATNALTADRRYLLQVTGAFREGYLTSKNKVGLLLDECPNDQRAVKKVVLPFLKQHGIEVASTRTFTCARGAGDAASAASQAQSAVLAFRSAGVDRVFAEGIPVVLFAQTAESQHYRPGYLVTSTTNGSALQPNMPAAQNANVHGYGWMPELDVDAHFQPPKTSTQQRCLSLLRSQQIVPTGYNDYLNAYTTCDGLFLYEQVLKATNGSSANKDVVGALNGLGTSYSGVGVYGGRTLLTSSHRDAPTRYRPWGWNTGCSCFRYTGAELPLP